MITTNSKHSFPVAPNVLNRDFQADKPNQILVADIMYIPTAEGWLYLAGVLDLFSRKVVGWEMSSQIDAELVDRALCMALYQRQPGKGFLHHSDQSSQYACYQIQVSMSGRGNCLTMP